VIPGERLPPAPFVYPIVDAGLIGRGRIGEVVSALARAGARLIQLRAKGLRDRALLDCVREAVAAAHAAGALLIVNDRPDVSRIVDADGVHVGQDDLVPGDVRRLLGPRAIVGISTHDLAQAVAASATGADYVAVGPVFATTTKQRADPVVGLDLVRAARAALAGPLVAIGGITHANARDVAAAGADGLAVASALLRAEDVGAALRAMMAGLRPGE
jgi:thiamine-phosphate pyrophosphorylase